jgi:hypothetical protein
VENFGGELSDTSSGAPVKREKEEEGTVLVWPARARQDDWTSAYLSVRVERMMEERESPSSPSTLDSSMPASDASL